MRVTTKGHRGASAAVLLVGGGALAAATWAAGDHGFAMGLVAFYLVTAAIAFAWAGRDTDIGAILRAGGDERQRRLDWEATAWSGLAMIAAAIIGTVVSVARDNGNPGGYGVICFVGGVAYALSLLVLRRRS